MDERLADKIMEEHSKWKPDDWKGTLDEWHEIVTLEYVLSQGYEEPGDEERYKVLHMKGWFGEESNT